MKIPLMALVLFVGSILIGCKPTETVRSDDPSPQKNEISFELSNWTAFQKKLAVPKDGKFNVTLVDAWATICAPCRKNFHHSVKLHEKYRSKGLRVISLSLDDRNDPKARDVILRFLTDQNATFENILLDEESDVGFEKLNINGIPALFLFDSDGKEIERFTNDDPNKPFSYDQIEQAIVKLLDPAHDSG